MSDIKVKIDVDGVKKVGDLLEDGLEAGAEEARDELLDVGKTSAKNIIVAEDLVWTSELFRSIKTFSHEGKNSYSGMVLADSRHAAPIEFGAEYDSEGPPISSLLPWVKAKLADWNYDGDIQPPVRRSPEDANQDYEYDPDPPNSANPEPLFSEGPQKSDDGYDGTDDLDGDEVDDVPEDFDPYENRDKLSKGQIASFQAGDYKRRGEVVKAYESDGESSYQIYVEDVDGTYTVTADRIINYVGSGEDVEDLDVGDRVSTGSTFTEVVGFRYDDDLDEKFVKIGQDGEMSDIVGADELRLAGKEYYIDDVEEDEVGTLTPSASDFDPSYNVGTLKTGEEVTFYPQESDLTTIDGEIKENFKDEKRFSVLAEDGETYNIPYDRINNYDRRGLEDPDSLSRGDLVSDGEEVGYVVRQDIVPTVFIFNEARTRVPSVNGIRKVPDEFGENNFRNSDIPFKGDIYLHYKPNNSDSVTKKKFEYMGRSTTDHDDGSTTERVIVKKVGEQQYGYVTRKIGENGQYQGDGIFKGYSRRPDATHISENGKRLNQFRDGARDNVQTFAPDGDEISFTRNINQQIYANLGSWVDIENKHNIIFLKEGDIIKAGSGYGRVKERYARGVVVSWGDEPERFVGAYNQGSYYTTSVKKTDKLFDIEKAEEWLSDTDVRFHPTDFAPRDGIKEISQGEEIRYEINDEIKTGVIKENLIQSDTISQFDYTLEDGTDIYLHHIEDFDGLGVSFNELEVGQVVSDGKRFLKIENLRNNSDGTGDVFARAHERTADTYDASELAKVEIDPHYELGTTLEDAKPFEGDVSVFRPEEGDKGIGTILRSENGVEESTFLTEDVIEEETGFTTDFSILSGDDVSDYIGGYVISRNDRGNLQINKATENRKGTGITLTQKGGETPAYDWFVPTSSLAADNERDIVAVPENPGDKVDLSDDVYTDRIFDYVETNYSGNKKYPPEELPNGDPIRSLATQGYSPEDNFYVGNNDLYSIEEDGFVGQKVAIYDDIDHKVRNFVVTKVGDNKLLRKVSNFSSTKSAVRPKNVIASTTDRFTDRDKLNDALDAALVEAESSELDKAESGKAIERILGELYEKGEGERVEEFAYNLRKIEDVRKNPDKDADKIGGYIDIGEQDGYSVTEFTLGVNEKNVDSEGVTNDALIHEIQHGYQFNDGHTLDMSATNEKTAEFGATSTIKYEFLEKGSKVGDLDAEYKYGPAYEQIVGDKGIPREDVFDVWAKTERDKITNSGEAGGADYQDITTSDLFGGDIDLEEGDYLRTEGGILNSGEEFVEVTRVNRDFSDDGVMVDIKDSNSNEGAFSVYDGTTYDGDVTGYAPSSSVDSEYETYYDPEVNPKKAYREVVSRVWYRAAIGSERDSNSGEDLEDVIKKWGVKDDGYSLSNPLETEAVAKEVFFSQRLNSISGEKNFNRIVTELVKNHPDLIYAYREWYGGSFSPTFKDELKKVTGEDTIEEAIKEVKP